MPWWAFGYVALWVASLVGNVVYRRRMQCSLPRLAAISFSGMFAVYFVFAFWHPALSERIWRLLPVMFAYMLATDVSMMRWALRFALRELEAGLAEDADGGEEVDPETEEARRWAAAAIAPLLIPVGIFVAFLFLLPAYVLAVKVCLR